MVIKSEYRGQGVLMTMLRYMVQLGASLGYPTSVSRQGVTARAILPTLAVAEGQHLGIIPKCLKVACSLI